MCAPFYDKPDLFQKNCDGLMSLRPATASSIRVWAMLVSIRIDCSVSGDRHSQAAWQDHQNQTSKSKKNPSLSYKQSTTLRRSIESFPLLQFTEVSGSTEALIKMLLSSLEMSRSSVWMDQRVFSIHMTKSNSKFSFFNFFLNAF